MKSILNFYLRSNYDNIEDYIDRDGEPILTIPRSYYLGNIKYGQYHSKIYIDSKCLYERFNGTRTFVQFVPLSKLQ